MEYYYTHKSNIKDDELIIDEIEYEHLSKVLRKKSGDRITVTNGELGIFECIIKSFTNKKIYCIITEKKHDLYEPQINITLFLSLLKNQDRFEFAVEKAVEIGVKRIFAISTAHTVKSGILSNEKMKRIEKIIIRAMGQSMRCFLPSFYNTVLLNNINKITRDYDYKIVMYEHSDIKNRFDYFKQNSNIALLIGPEGGFSEKEITYLIDTGWATFSLGNRKLRSETAAIISLFEIINRIIK